MTECGACRYWTKWKNDGRGLCSKLDCSGKAEHGRGCPHFQARRHKRSRMALLRKIADYIQYEEADDG